MPSPFTFDITKPAGTDAINIGDDQIRTDKTTLRDVLRTLVPFGTPTTGWRVVQINNDTYMVHNAKYDGTNWSHDDTSIDAKGVRIAAAGGLIETIFRAAAASTWATSAWLVGFEVAIAASVVNRIKASASTTGNPVVVEALGTDTNIDIQLKPKGTGFVRGTEQQFINGSIGQLAADNTTRFMALTGSDTPGTVEQDHLQLVGRALTAVKITVNLDSAPNGVGKTRTLTLRNSGADTALTVTFTNAESGIKTATGSVAIAGPSTLSWGCAAAGTPDASRVQMAVMAMVT